MAPKKKGGEAVVNDDRMRAARFGRVKNDLSMGFVGLPNVGKSSLTNLLCGQMHAEAANYPFCTIDPNFVRVTVPDKNFKYLADCFYPPSVVPAVLKVVDIAGLIKGASEGEGLGNAFLSHIAAVDGIYHLVRCFDDPEVVHVNDDIDPIRDMDTILSELCLKDLQGMESLLEAEKSRIRKEKGIGKSTEPPLSDAFKSAYDKVMKLLNSTTPVSNGTDFTLIEVGIIREWSLITAKPIVYIINMDRKSFIRKGNKWLPKINDWVKEHGGGQIIPMSVEFEQELFDLNDDKDAQKAFLDQCTEDAKTLYNITNPNLLPKSVLTKMIRSGRQALCLQSYYTAGPKEVRSWTIQKGSLAPQAAGVIHSDFERGFIKAEIASFADFQKLHDGQPSMAKIKDAGKYRQEGKQYVMQDGDIVLFQFNVSDSKKK